MKTNYGKIYADSVLISQRIKHTAPFSSLTSTVILVSIWLAMCLSSVQAGTVDRFQVIDDPEIGLLPDGQQFGSAIGVSGDTAAVAGVGDAAGKDGRVFLFKRAGGNQGGWQQIQLLRETTTPDARYGFSVALQSDLLAVGAPWQAVNGGKTGVVFLYRRAYPAPEYWLKIAELTPDDGVADGRFGASLALDGDILVVGSPKDDDHGVDSGSVYLYQQNIGGQDAWGLARKISPPDGKATALFGTSIDLSGVFLAVGAANDDPVNNGSGSAYVFGRNTGGADNWGLVKKLVATDRTALAAFGSSISAAPGLIFVGAEGDGQNGVNSGAVYQFAQDSGGVGNWGQVRKILATDGSAYDYFGASLATDGLTLVVGAEREDTGGNDAGAVYLYERDAGGPESWGLADKIPYTGRPDAFFGWSVTLAGEVALVGAPLDDNLADGGQIFGASGSLTTLGRGTGHWEVAGKTLAVDKSHVIFGSSLALYGDTLAIARSASLDGEPKVSFYRSSVSVPGWNHVRSVSYPSTDPNFASFGEHTVLGDGLLAVAARGENGGRGAIAVFTKSAPGNDDWQLAARLLADDAEGIGFSLALQDDTIFAGDSLNNTSKGAVYVSQHSPGNRAIWSTLRKIMEPPALEEFDEFGQCVGVDGDTLVVGASGDDDVSAAAGAVYIYGKTGSPPDAWKYEAKVVNPNGREEDRFGRHCAVHGDTLVVGAWREDHGPAQDSNEGAVYVYGRDGAGPGGWRLVRRLVAPQPKAGEFFGDGVAVFDQTILVRSQGPPGEGPNITMFKQDEGGQNNWGSVWDLRSYGYSTLAFGGTKYIVPITPLAINGFALSRGIVALGGTIWDTAGSGAVALFTHEPTAPAGMFFPIRTRSGKVVIIGM